MMQLRPYQAEAIDAINARLADCTDHGVVSIPTAGGKTIIFATMIHRWLDQWPGSRVAILAHRQELLSQAEEKLKRLWPLAPAGVWSAGLKRREGNYDVLIAGIQSVYRRALDFEPFDIVIIDEAHLVPNSSDTMYRQFLADAKLNNPNVRYIGFTATPYRLDGGNLCGPNRLFNSVWYEAEIARMIDDGYLCQLRTKATETRLNVDGVHTRQGDFVPGELAAKVDTTDLVGAAVDEIVRKGEGRRAWLVFCCGVEHARHVSEELGRRGIDAPVVVGNTDKEDRGTILADFDAGRIRCVVNVNCLTTGLDVTRIDLIAVLRPTQSTSLFVQMVGRGFRLLPGVIDGLEDAPSELRLSAIAASAKPDCLVLDFGENCLRHGPLNALKIKTKNGDCDGEAPAKACPGCQEYVPAGVLECPCCGYQFPPREIKHEKRATDAPIILNSKTEPWTIDVEAVEVERHEKQGKPPSLQVTYHGGYHERHREWICLEHTGYAQTKARHWWRRRFGEPIPATVTEAMADMFLGNKIQNVTKSITVRWAGKYTEVVGAELQGEREYGAIAR
jgi:DNA repair protein RadD